MGGWLRRNERTEGASDFMDLVLNEALPITVNINLKLREIVGTDSIIEFNDGSWEREGGVSRNI